MNLGRTIRKSKYGISTLGLLCFVIAGSNIYAHSIKLVHPFSLSGKAVKLVIDDTGGVQDPKNSVYAELYDHFYFDYEKPNTYNPGEYFNNYKTAITKTGTQGSIDEDFPIINVRYHFYNPVTGRGLSRWPFGTWTTAKERSGLLWNEAITACGQGNKQKGYERLGHVIHLLQDMGVPSHVQSDTHLFGDDYEAWCADYADNSKTYKLPDGNQISQAANLSYDNFIEEVALKTNQACRIEGHLNADKNNPVEGDLNEVFPAITFLNYVSESGDEAYWSIAGVGDCYSGPNKSPTGADDWWRCEPRTSGEYYYLESVKNAIPENYWDTGANSWVQNNAKYNICKLWAGGVNGWVTPTQGTELIPLAINYSSGLMKYFYNLVNEPPVVKQVRVSNSNNKCMYDGYWTTVLKYNNDNLSSNSTTFDVSPAGSVVSQDGRKRFNNIEELYKEINNDSEYTFVSAKREFTQTTKI